MPLLPRPLLALLAVLGLVLGIAGGGGARACDAAAHGPHAAMPPAAPGAPAPPGDAAPDCHPAPDGLPCTAGWHCPTLAAPAPEALAAAPTTAPAGARHAVRATLVPGPIAELEPPPPRA